MSNMETIIESNLPSTDSFELPVKTAVEETAKPVETAEQGNKKESPTWKNYQKVAFRIAFVYFLILCIPSYWSFYEGIWKIKLSKIVYHDLQNIVAFWPPQFITIE